MKTIGIYNDETKYTIPFYKIIPFEGDIELMKPDAKTTSEMEYYSQTHMFESLKTIDIIKSHSKTNDILLVDGTTSIGGNFMDFIKVFKYNIGIEINKERYNKLAEKLSSIAQVKNRKDKSAKFILNNNKISLLNHSFTDVYEKIIETNNKMNIFFFLDPPWGGREYKNFDKIIFGLGGKSLDNIVNNIKKHNNTHIAIKLPNNFYTDIFKNNFVKYDFKKYQLLIF